LVRFGLVAFLFDAAELGERAEIAALQAAKLAEDLLEGVAGGGVGLPDVAEGAYEVGAHGQDAVEVGLGAVKAAAEPVAADEGIDEVTLDGGCRTALVLVFAGEALKIGRILAWDDGTTGVDAVLESVEAGSFLPSGSARPG